MTPIEERFFKFVSPEPNSGCWLWDGSVTTKGGYAAIYDNRRKNARRASHISLEIHGRPQPQGMLALHKCDVPACVNPDHLYWGNAAQNTNDMISRGRDKMRESSKELCLRGHPLIGENIYTPPSGGRHCKQCARLRQRKRKPNY